jgi:hypothetical protein
MALSFNEGAALGGSLGDLISSGLDAAGLSAKARARAINDQRFGLSPQAPTGLAGLLQPTQTPVAQNAQGMTGSVAGGQATLSKPTPAPLAAQQAAPQAAAQQPAFGQGVKTEDLIAVLRDPNSSDQDKQLAGMLFKGRQPLDAKTQADIANSTAQTKLYEAQAGALGQKAPQEPKVIGKDVYGNDIYGLYDQGSGKWVPTNPQAAASAESHPELAGMPVGYDPKKYVEEQYQQQKLEKTADELGYKPGTPERAQFISSGGKNTAPKTTEDQDKNRQIYHDILPEMTVVQKNWDGLGSAADAAGKSFGSRFGLSGYTTSSEYQRGSQALQYIIQNSMYSKSGQSAPEGEVARMADALMPKPGEGADVRKDKLQRIKTLVDGVKIRAYGGGNAPGVAAGSPPSGDFQPIGDTGYSIRQVD